MDRNLVPSQRIPEALETYNEQTPRVGTHREQRLSEKGQGGVPTPSKEQDWREDDIVVGKPLHLRQKSISISPWESKHWTKKHPSSHSSIGDITLENPSSAPDPDQILTVDHQGC